LPALFGTNEARQSLLNEVVDVSALMADVIKNLISKLEPQAFEIGFAEVELLFGAGLFGGVGVFLFRALRDRTHNLDNIPQLTAGGENIPPPGKKAPRFVEPVLSGNLFPAVPQAEAPDALRPWKHCRQKTGRPCVGLKGTVVSRPHWEQMADVSTRCGAPLRSCEPLSRFALQALQRLGSFLKSFS
jgi:hypothetical protein